LEDLQQRIRQQGVLQAGFSAAGRLAAHHSAASPVAAPASSPLSNPHVLLLDELLLLFLSAQHRRNVELSRMLEAERQSQIAHAEHQRAVQVKELEAHRANKLVGLEAQRSMELEQHRQAALRHVEQQRAMGVANLPPPGQLPPSYQPLKRAAVQLPPIELPPLDPPITLFPPLPFIRKVFATQAIASPFAPRAAALQGNDANPLLGLIFSLPHVLHAYVEFECDDHCDSSSAAPLSAAAISTQLRVSRVAVVHWSELGVLVDAHATSAFLMMREISAQAQVALWAFRQRAEEKVRIPSADSPLLQHRELRVLYEWMVRDAPARAERWTGHVHCTSFFLHCAVSHSSAVAQHLLGPLHPPLLRLQAASVSVGASVGGSPARCCWRVIGE
jgi:hypothetical protein